MIADLSEIPTHELMQEIQRRLERTNDLAGPAWARPILRVVADAEGIDVGGLLTVRRRTALASLRRHMAMTLLRAYTGRSLEQIGSLWGVGHDTVLHGMHRVASLATTDPVFRGKWQQIHKRCRGDMWGSPSTPAAACGKSPTSADLPPSAAKSRKTPTPA